MGWLVPNITRPVTLKLSADDVTREAWGRGLSLAGAGVGILGGLMVLNANPAFSGILASKQSSQIQLTAQQAKQDAMGKSLALIGTAVGTVGSVMVMAASPKLKAKFSSTWNSLPPAVKAHQGLVAFGAIAALTFGTLYLIRSQNESLVEDRYQA